MAQDYDKLTWFDLPMLHFRERNVEYAHIEDNPVFMMAARRLKRSKWLYWSYIYPIVLGMIFAALIHTYYIWLLPIVVLIYTISAGSYSELWSIKRLFGFNQKHMLEQIMLTSLSMRTVVIGRIALNLTGRRFIQSILFSLTLTAYYVLLAINIKSNLYIIVNIALIYSNLAAWTIGMDAIVLGYHYWICQAVWFNCSSLSYKRIANILGSGLTGALIGMMFGGIILFFSVIVFGIISAILESAGVTVVWQTLPVIGCLLLLILLALQGSTSWRANLQYSQAYCHNVMHMLVSGEAPEFNPYVKWLGTGKR